MKRLEVMLQVNIDLTRHVSKERFRALVREEVLKNNFAITSAEEVRTDGLRD